jgi:hypothetical protein
MDSFKWITVTISIILGVGITGMLSSAVALFRARGAVRMDWIPLVWAACIFLWLLQYWWAVIELSGLVRTWTILEFSVLLLLVLLLYVSSALVLPAQASVHGADLAAAFEHDGRWALIFLSAYFAVALVANVYLWQTQVLNYAQALDAILVMLPVLYLRTRARRGQAFVTVLYAALSLVSAWLASPKAY